MIMFADDHPRRRCTRPARQQGGDVGIAECRQQSGRAPAVQIRRQGRYHAQQPCGFGGENGRAESPGDARHRPNRGKQAVRGTDGEIDDGDRARDFLQEMSLPATHHEVKRVPAGGQGRREVEHDAFGTAAALERADEERDGPVVQRGGRTCPMIGG